MCRILIRYWPPMPWLPTCGASKLFDDDWWIAPTVAPGDSVSPVGMKAGFRWSYLLPAALRISGPDLTHGQYAQVVQVVSHLSTGFLGRSPAVCQHGFESLTWVSALCALGRGKQLCMTISLSSGENLRVACGCLRGVFRCVPLHRNWAPFSRSCLDESLRT